MLPAAIGSARREYGGRPRGFTLLEVLIVLMVLVLLAGISWPALHNRLAHSQLPEAADRFRSLMYLSRAAAMMEHRRVRIRFELNEQQPIIEFEPDPIGAAGTYIPLHEDWVEGNSLPDTVHVHDIIPGRPAYLTPVSSAAPEDTGDQVGVETTTELNEGQEAVAFVDPMKCEKCDPHRPGIVFEPDGSTDWATVVMAEMRPSDPLIGTDRQYWIILDGRTGLAKVREGISDTELASAEFSIPREKLILPRTTDVKDLTLTINSPEGATSLGGQGSLFGASGMGQQGGNSAQSAAEAITSKVPELPTPPATPPLDSSQVNTMEELEKQLAANTDLTEDEKNQIRKTFQENLNKAGSAGQAVSTGSAAAAQPMNTTNVKKGR